MGACRGRFRPHVALVTTAQETASGLCTAQCGEGVRGVVEKYLVPRGGEIPQLHSRRCRTPGLNTLGRSLKPGRQLRDFTLIIRHFWWIIDLFLEALADDSAFVAKVRVIERINKSKHVLIEQNSHDEAYAGIDACGQGPPTQKFQALRRGMTQAISMKLVYAFRSLKGTFEHALVTEK